MSVSNDDRNLKQERANDDDDRLQERGSSRLIEKPHTNCLIDRAPLRNRRIVRPSGAIPGQQQRVHTYITDKQT